MSAEGAAPVPRQRAYGKFGFVPGIIRCIIQSMQEFTPDDEAEVIRKKYRYRQLILTGRLKLPHDRAAQLLGPDCLYRLYSLAEPVTRPSRKKRN
jgi:hypothetical protein